MNQIKWFLRIAPLVFILAAFNQAGTKRININESPPKGDFSLKKSTLEIIFKHLKSLVY
jgi:hypothetical protein